MAEKRVLFANASALTEFPTNYTSTTKYNALTFLPLSLLSQFMRIPNIYFLVTAILQSIPEISPLSPVSAIAPLVFVISVSMIREGIEDYMRYRSDQEINSAVTLAYIRGEFRECPYKDIKVGDVVQVRENEVFPCDLIMLNNPNDNGVAFVETSTLDGEKNLKPRMAFSETLETLDKETIRLVSMIECELPNAKIEQFNGKIIYRGAEHALNKNQLLQSGAFLRNTAWAVGVAVYTGNDTKLRQNLLSRRIKMSTVEHRLNKYILWIIASQFLLCLAGALGGGAWAASNYEDHWYLGEAVYSAGVQGFLNFFTYFLLLNTMLPISLIISLEIVKMAQGLCMQRDPELYSRVRERYCKVSSFSLNEELGMIQHVFTDKTGTLTSNRMEFKCCTIGRVTYGEQRARAGTIPRVATYTDKVVNFTFRPRALQEDTFTKEPQDNFDPLPMAMNNTVDMFDSQAKLNRYFLRCLALCHECLAKVDASGNLQYSGQSPDEIALVDCARWVGYAYTKARGSTIDIEVKYGNDSAVERYEKLCLFEFNSDRKRNSVIVTDRETQQHFLFAKGADNIMFSRLSDQNNQRFVQGIRNEVNRNSAQGLRTLLLACKLLSPEEFDKISEEFQQRSCDVNNRDALIDELAESVEQDFFLLGCTAVEDALQDEVPATLNDFLEAGINVWMLTGDKMETAENIGQTCSLLAPDMNIWKITATELEECSAQLEQVSKEFAATKGQPAALIVQGEALEFLLFHDSYQHKFPSQHWDILRQLSDEFFRIAEGCKTIICCRATPGQKQSVVKSVKVRSNSVTLAVGDGANDVSMILEAHIGIGLYGEEGMQAVQSSDYAIGEFKFLWELLFVHGRFNYIRQSDMIMYFFYKNLVFTLPQFFFMFVCAYSGQTVYDDWYITMYNLMFTALPLLFRALFDYDIIVPRRSEIGRPEQYLMPTFAHPNLFAKVRKTVPRVYSIGKNNQLFTPFKFGLWMCAGVFHSLLVCYLPLMAAREGVLGSNGHSHSLWTFSITSFTCVIILVNVKLAYCIRNWNLWIHLSVFGSSILLYFAFILIYDSFATTPSYLTLYELLGSYYFYFSIFMLVMLVIVIDGSFHIMRRLYFPTDSEQLMDFSLQVKAQKARKNRVEDADSDSNKI